MPFQEEPVHALHVNSPALSTLLELPPKCSQRLQRAGFTTASEVILTRPDSLKSKTGLSAEEVHELYDCLSDLCAPVPRTVLELAPTSGGSFVTLGSPALDRLFGAGVGGVPTGQLTEISGESTSGKTCMSLQLALNVQLPVELGGLRGGCVYLCTESSFPSGRLYEMAAAMCDRLRKTGRERQAPIGAEHLMENVHLLRVHDPQTLIHTIHYSLPVFLERQNTNPGQIPIRLVVLDSIGAIFRTDLEQNSWREAKVRMTERAAEMHQVADGLKVLASRHELAVVVVNQVSDVFEARAALSRPTGPGREEARSAAPTEAGSPPSTGPSIHSATEASSSAGSLLSAERDAAPLPLLYHPQAYHFTGQAVTENRKEAALGLTWTSALNARIMLHRLNRESGRPVHPCRTDDVGAIEYSTPRVREAQVVFSPFGKTRLDEMGRGVQYVIEGQGIVAATEDSL